MKNDDTDSSLRHDPLGQNQDENQLADKEFEDGADTDEVESAEESALNIDNDTARDADAGTEEGIAERELEAEIKEFDEELKDDEQKHKGRQSTSEKAKAAKSRQSTSEKAKEAEEVKARILDPLRLHGKKYRAAAAEFDRAKTYAAAEALELVKKTSTSKFDSAVELHAKVKADNVRGTLTLPHGNGKTRRVAVADDETIEKIAAGHFDFDVLLAKPSQMPKLAKYAKQLGPKGLMPSPKAGTVTDDVDGVSQEINGGRVEYRADKTGVIHMSIGKVSFSTENLLENFRVIEVILLGSKLQSLTLASTMGPGVKVSLA
jgi:large subunit ribosomal protein L1